ncbi:MAG: hypothetical protein IPP97_11195 [Candidatus Obscuribacter sp.]|nr:hypothetical protein [Candidatus Obscuribacter sp.]MBL0186291.1 hypothetical protein [Candidatus Obscuribacter sp.]
MNIELTLKQADLIKRLAWAIPALYFLFFVMGFPLKNIERGHTGVDMFYGKILGSRQAGWSYKAPFIEVKEITNQGITTELSDTENATHDLQVATININSQWTILSGGTAELYNAFGDETAIQETLIVPGLMEVQKALSAKYDAYDLQQKAPVIAEEARTEMLKWLKQSLALRGLPMQIDVASVLFPHVGFSAEFAAATTEQTQTEQSIGTFEYVRTEEVTKAKASRDARIREAKGTAYETRKNADAETIGIIAKAESLEANPDMLCYMVQKGWDGVLPEVTTAGASPLPFAEVCKK